MLIGRQGPAVVLDPRTCAWLEKYADLSRLRREASGTDRQITQQLTEIRVAAMAWRTSSTGSAVAETPELDARLPWKSTSEAAEELSMTDRGVRQAITGGRLDAKRVGRSYRISNESIAHFRAATKD